MMCPWMQSSKFYSLIISWKVIRQNFPSPIIYTVLILHFITVIYMLWHYLRVGINKQSSTKSVIAFLLANLL